MTFEQLHSKKGEELSNAIFDLMGKPEDFLFLYNTCQNEAEKLTLRGWVIELASGWKSSSWEFYLQLLLRLVEVSREQGDAGDISWWILGLFEQHNDLRAAIISATTDYAAVKVDPKNQPVIDDFSGLASKMVVLLKTDPLFTYKIDRFPKTNKDFPPINPPKTTFEFLRVGYGFFAGRNRSLSLRGMICSTPKEFWRIFDSCLDVNERKILMDWLLDWYSSASTVSHKNEQLFDISSFIYFSDFSDDERHAERRWALLYFLEHGPEFVALVLGSEWHLSENFLIKNKFLEIYQKLLEILYAEILLLVEKFPKLLAGFASQFLSVKPFTAEYIDNIQRLSQENMGGLTKEKAEVAMKIRAAFQILFTYAPQVALVEAGRVASFGRVSALQALQSSQQAIFVQLRNFCLGFFGQQRNDFFAKLLMDNPDVCKAFFTKVPENFVELAKLFAKPSEFVGQYGEYATDQALSEVVVNVASSVPDDLQSLWQIRLGLLRGTVGKVMSDYVGKLGLKSHYSSDRDKFILQEFFTSPAIFEYYQFNFQALRFSLKGGVIIPAEILEFLAFHPRFRDLFLAETSWQQSQFQLDTELLALVERYTPFLIKAIADVRTRAMALKRLLGKPVLLRRFIEYSELENNIPEFQSIRQEALTVMANDPTCSAALISIGVNAFKGKEYYFLLWAKQNRAWFDRLFFSNDATASEFRKAAIRSEGAQAKVFNIIASVDRSAFVYLAKEDENFRIEMLLKLDWVVKHVPEVLYVKTFCDELKKQGLWELGKKTSPHWWCVTHNIHPLEILMARNSAQYIHSLPSELFDKFKKFFTIVLSGSTSPAERKEYWQDATFSIDHGESWFQQGILEEFMLRLDGINEAQLIALLCCITVDDADQNKLKLRKNILRAYLNAHELKNIASVDSGDVGDKNFMGWLEAACLEISKEMEYSVLATPIAVSSAAMSTFYAPPVASPSSSSSGQYREEVWRKDIADKLADTTFVIDPCIVTLLNVVLGKPVDADSFREQLVLAMNVGIDVAQKLEEKFFKQDSVTNKTLEEDPKLLASAYDAIIKFFEKSFSRETIEDITKVRLNFDELRINRLFKVFQARYDALTQKAVAPVVAQPRQ